jgi:hypothetical protein
MSKEVQIISWCDGDHEEDTPAAVERELSLDRSKPVLLDLCETCDKQVQDLQELMQQGVLVERAETQLRAGRRIRKAPEASDRSYPEPVEERTCPDKNCFSGVDGGPLIAASRQALSSHTRKMHGKRFADYPGFRKPTRVKSE